MTFGIALGLAVDDRFDGRSLCAMRIRLACSLWRVSRHSPTARLRPGYGEAIAADTGGAINGHRIDLCMESYNECMDFGRRAVTVYVLE